ncbi:unnamed protein product, partial [Adineta steineri]
LHLTKPVHIVEETYQEKEGILSATGRPASFQNLLDAKTITVHVTVNVTFDLKAKDRQHKKDEKKK